VGFATLLRFLGMPDFHDDLSERFKAASTKKSSYIPSSLEPVLSIFDCKLPLAERRCDANAGLKEFAKLRLTYRLLRGRCLPGCRARPYSVPSLSMVWMVRTFLASASSMVLRPSLIPSARTLASPAMTLSRIIARSNSANTPSI
jgi:hypothetical protein